MKSAVAGIATDLEDPLSRVRSLGPQSLFGWERAEDELERAVRRVDAEDCLTGHAAGPDGPLAREGAGTVQLVARRPVGEPRIVQESGVVAELASVRE